MANVIFAITAALVTVSAYLGYALGRREAEESAEEQQKMYMEAARSARMRAIENRSRFYDILREAQDIETKEATP